MSRNIAICHHCPHRQRPCFGACACTLDGRDILEHASTGYCPAGRFDTAPEPPPLPEPVPRDRWPLAVRVVAKLAHQGETGVGDTLARLIVGGEKFKRLMKRIGVDCGCAARQAQLNALYGYRIDSGASEAADG